MSPFQIHPAYRAYSRKNPGKTFFPNWWIRDWSVEEIESHSTSDPNGTVCLKVVSQNVSHLDSSHQTRDLECFEDRYSIPWNPPPIFFQTWLQQYGRGAFFHSAHCSLHAVLSLILNHGVLLKISTSGPKILISNFLLDTSLHHSFQSVIIKS